MFSFSAERFFDFNQRWLLREVVRLCYDNTYQVADFFGTHIAVQCAPQPLDALVEYIKTVAGKDDWVDIIRADGLYIRNIQRGWHGR